MHAAITICLVPEARQGPFVCHGLADDADHGLEAGCRMAAELGFAAVEIFPQSAETFPRAALRRLLAAAGLGLAAVGTGAGWLKHKLHLCHADPSVRGKAREFIAGIIAGAGLGWGLDNVAGSRPWGMIVMTMLGFGAGIWNVMRASGFVRPPDRPGGDAGPGN